VNVAWERIKYDPLRAVALVAVIVLVAVLTWQAVSIGPYARDTLKETKAAAVEAKMRTVEAKPIIENANKFVEAGTEELRAKSDLLGDQIRHANKLFALNQRQINTTADLLNGNRHSSYCPIGSTPNGFSSEGTPYCNIPGALPELTVAIHNFGAAGEEFRKAGETVNAKVLPSAIRILATVEDLMKQPEWKAIAPEVLAMVKHWRETGANVKDITADIKKMADDAVNPKKRGLWLTLLGIVGRMIVGPGVQGLVQR